GLGKLRAGRRAGARSRTMPQLETLWAHAREGGARGPFGSKAVAAATHSSFKENTMAGDVFVLGGAQTDFARNWTREGRSIFDMMSETVRSGLEATGLDAHEVQTAHVGNFVAELFCGQGQLGGLFAAID